MSPMLLGNDEEPLSCHLHRGVRGRCGRGRDPAQTGVQPLTGSCKDDGGGHAAPLARPRCSGAGGVAVAAEEAAVAEDEQLQSAVWGRWGSQGSRKGREQAGWQLDGGQGHAVLGGQRSSSETPGVP